MLDIRSRQTLNWKKNLVRLYPEPCMSLKPVRRPAENEASITIESMLLQHAHCHDLTHLQALTVQMPGIADYVKQASGLSDRATQDSER